MSSFLKVGASLIAATALAACGGGGDDSPTSAKYTQADVKNVATLGASSLVITGDRVGLILYFLGNLLQGISTDAGGSRSSPAASCASTQGGGGTLAFTLTKSAVRTGLAVGDQLTYTFVNCSFSAGAMVLNGTFVLTAQSVAANLNAATYQVGFRANMTNFSTLVGGTTTTVSGSIDVNSASGVDATGQPVTAK